MVVVACVTLSRPSSNFSMSSTVCGILSLQLSIKAVIQRLGFFGTKRNSLLTNPVRDLLLDGPEG